MLKPKTFKGEAIKLFNPLYWKVKDIKLVMTIKWKKLKLNLYYTKPNNSLFYILDILIELQ